MENELQAIAFKDRDEITLETSSKPSNGSRGSRFQLLIRPRSNFSHAMFDVCEWMSNYSDQERDGLHFL